MAQQTLEYLFTNKIITNDEFMNILHYINGIRNKTPIDLAALAEQKRLGTVYCFYTPHELSGVINLPSLKIKRLMESGAIKGCFYRYRKIYKIDERKGYQIVAPAPSVLEFCKEYSTLHPTETIIEPLSRSAVLMTTKTYREWYNEDQTA